MVTARLSAEVLTSIVIGTLQLALGLLALWQQRRLLRMNFESPPLLQPRHRLGVLMCPCRLASQQQKSGRIRAGLEACSGQTRAASNVHI